MHRLSLVWVFACLFILSDTAIGQEVDAQVADLFAKSCARSGCHAGPVAQMGMNLTPEQFYASTVNEPSRERPEIMRVHPGQPELSYLLMKVKGEQGIIGSPMPLVGDRLSEEEIQVLEDWITGLEEVDEARKQEQPTLAYPFDGWKMVNLPTTRTVDRGSWFFLISHRFVPKLSTGYETFFGLDGSGVIFLSLGYAITDDLLINLGRSNANDNVELQARYRFMQQDVQKRTPVGLAAQASINWITEKQEGKDVFRGEAFKFTAQVPVTRQLTEGVGVGLVPGILFNPDENKDGESPLITIGLGGRWRFHRNLSIVAEWVPIVSGYTETFTVGQFNRFDSWGGGLEIATGGHVFQIIVTNSVGLATDHYLRGGDLDIREGEMRLGFNIFRILNFR